jgi:flagellar biosynthesis/type III secretory pathway protein FliH
MGRVVKGHGHVVPAAVMDARAEAAALVAAAQREAEALGAAAAAERERARRLGYEDGRAQAAAELVGVLAAARAEAEEMLARAEPAALTIAGKMAEKIVGRAVALDPALMADIAGEALDACRTREGAVTLRVHPEHLAAVERERGALVARLGDAAALEAFEIVGDDAVERLGCVVETPVGRVDARLSTLLEALTSSLTGGGRA